MTTVTALGRKGNGKATRTNKEKCQEMEARVASLAARAIYGCEALPERIGSGHLRDQLFRSATSVAANYAEASVPESKKDFAHKMSIALKELVESRMWLRIIALKQYVDPSSLQSLLRESDELIRIFHASVITTRQHLADEQP